MTNGLVAIGVALIVALQAALVMGAVWFGLGRWFTGKERAIAALAVSLAFWVGVYSNASGDVETFEPKVLAVAAIHFGVTFCLFKIELGRADLDSSTRNG